MIRTIEEWEIYYDENIEAGPMHKSSRLSAPMQGFIEANKLTKFLSIKPSSRIADIGCGNGRIAIGLSSLEMNFLYHGLDIIEKCIEFCDEAFKDIPDFYFSHLDIQNERYNNKGIINPDEIIYPYEDNYFDLVIFSSIFSHVYPIETIEKMLAEAWRILKNNGYCYCTWFLSPPNSVTSDFSRVVYSEIQLKKAIKNWFIMDSTEGWTTNFHDQRKIILAKSKSSIDNLQIDALADRLTSNK